MTRRIFLIGAMLGAALGSCPALASPLALTGNYIKAGISDAGTLGSDGNASPGLLHDPTGHGAFGVNDYITPGTPHDGFSLVADQFAWQQNDNAIGLGNFGSASPVLLTGSAALGYANAASWSGSNGLVDVTNSYFFNPGDQRILVMTTLTALGDLTGLAFARSVDPDPDVNTFGSFATNNQRGNSLYGLSDFVGAAGPETGLTLALVNLSGDTYVHNTMIGSSCCSNFNPNDVLAGNGIDANFQDSSLNLAYRIGNLARGDSVTLSYSYSVGDNIDVVGPPTGGVPEPVTWASMLLGFGMVGHVLRARRSTLRYRALP